MATGAQKTARLGRFSKEISNFRQKFSVTFLGNNVSIFPLIRYFPFGHQYIMSKLGTPYSETEAPECIVHVLFEFTQVALTLVTGSTEEFLLISSQSYYRLPSVLPRVLVFHHHTDNTL